MQTYSIGETKHTTTRTHIPCSMVDPRGCAFSAPPLTRSVTPLVRRASQRRMPQPAGFTLVEMMVTLAISGIVLVAISMIMQSQSKSYLAQEQVTEMQQNLRAAMGIMLPEISMIGFDPTKTAPAGIPGIPGNMRSSVQFTMDITGGENDGIDNDGDGLIDAADAPDEAGYGDGDLNDDNEQVIYRLADDADDDGIADGGDTELVRSVQTGGVMGPPEPIAENVEAFALAYAYDADNDRTLDTDGAGNIIWAQDTDGDNRWDNLDTDGNGIVDANDGPGFNASGVINGTPTGTLVNWQQVRAVRVWLLVRSRRGNLEFSDTTTYTVGNQVIYGPDRDGDLGFRRRTAERIIHCRNMGL